MNAATPARLRLAVGASATTLTLDIPATAPRQWHWPLGHATLWAALPGGPSPVMIENAIQVVEDQIEAVARHVPAGARLVASAVTLAPLQRGGATAGLQQGAIALAQIEREVQSLAARSMGAPSARTLVFDHPAGDALVLILRECLHHLGLDAVHLQD
ncbi:MAG: hypothetical protein ACR2JA_08515 [Hydrogenophaga sp.]|uniref:hypothetical protein n=1 Tax=Hydrogenophaga sp. TaxID=1904254 RepID=UPI003D9AD480